MDFILMRKLLTSVKIKTFLKPFYPSLVSEITSSPGKKKEGAINLWNLCNARPTEM